jgi:ParB-like chromosome segregation protein Spo0J
MTSKKNKACTLKVGQIEKNPILALGTSEKDIEKYVRVTKAYGNVAPAIVGQSGNAYRILAGQASLEACAHHGFREMPVIVAKISNEAEQMKLALLLSTVREDGCPLSEGAFIDALTTHHGVTRQELMVLLNKSKSWMSRRQSLVLRLSEDVKGMVKDGTICARTAEEIAKLPKDKQITFASNVVRDSLNKTNAGQLASLYTHEGTSPELQKAILDSPLDVLDACPAVPYQRHKEKRGLAERIAGNAGFLIRLAGEMKGLLAKAGTQELTLARPHLAGLAMACADLNTVITGLMAKVSPGELQGGDTP